MRVSRRVVVALLALLAIGAVLVFRINTRVDPPAGDSETSPRAEDPGSAGDALPPTSEELIAAALKAGDITYEESLLARAYAIFDDPRLDPAFRSPIVNWHAGSELFIEVDNKEATLSKDLLAALAPFRARPNDPISIVNRPRADVLKAQARTVNWVGRQVLGTNLTIWMNGRQSDLDDYEPIFKQVWDAFPDFFSYPLDDDPGPDLMINPDGTIDFYLLQGADVDPRIGVCGGSNPNPAWCRPAGRAVTIPAAWRGYRSSSAYVLVDLERYNIDLFDTIAHELAHVSQFGYDNEEPMWLKDSTASWVGYKVVKKLLRTPNLAYDRAAQFFKGLQLSLPREGGDNEYHSWLFFFYASTELGNGIVEEVWRQAKEPGVHGVRAVDAAMPLKEHFPKFTVRNWNQESAPQYRTWDTTFRPGLVPLGIVVPGSGLGRTELDEAVPHLAAQYYEYDYEQRDEVRRVTFENLFKDLPDAHIWAIPQIDAVWKNPEDWTGTTQKVFCRDNPGEDLTGLILIVSNSHLTNDDALPAAHPKPRVTAEDVGCPYLEGWAKATVRVRDERQDMTYASSRANLRFRPRSIQDVLGNVQYDLMPTSVRWTASGRIDDCKVTGDAVVDIPGFLDQDIDTTRPAYGYMNVIGLGGGDFHHVMIAAAPNASMRKTCPGPVVTNHPFQAGYLLHIVSNANTHDGSVVAYKGNQQLDMGDPFANLPDTARDFGFVFPGGQQTGPGPSPPSQGIEDLPQVKEMLRNFQKGRVVYTFEYELRPGPPPP